MIVLIDNYDSFTFNLVHYLGGLGADVVVHRNDKITADDVIVADPDAIVLSPGPCTPNEAGICLELIEKAATAKVPLMGVCLGHQAIGQVFGGKVVRAPVPVHGKVSEIRHTATGVFRGINGPFKATRYHSLVVDRASLPSSLTVNAETDDLIMGMMHKELPVHGVQFHPESIASEHGHLMLKNFLDLSAAWNTQRGRRAQAAPTRAATDLHVAG